MSWKQQRKCKPTILSDGTKRSDTATFESRLAWSYAIDSRISLAYAAGEDDPTSLVADIFPAHKRIGYDKKTDMKIMDDDNRDIAIFIITHKLNTCRAIIIQGDDGKNILPSVFRSMGLVGVILSDKMIQHLVPDYKMTRAEYSMEGNFPMYLTFNKKMGKTCFILTCPQIGLTLVRPNIGLEGKLWTRVIHRLVSVFLKITGAKYHQECFPDFTTVEESVLSILSTKKGASDHMELLHKSGQLLNVVIFKAPCQIGGENLHCWRRRLDSTHRSRLSVLTHRPTLTLGGVVSVERRPILDIVAVAKWWLF
jgi:hypothetical protein